MALGGELDKPNNDISRSADMSTAVMLRGLDWAHIRLTYVAPFYINKPNGAEVLGILNDYAQYPAEILDRVLLVLVDDGSPLPYTLPEVPLNLIVLRVQEDIPWNNPGARNLGMVYAKSDKVFLTDIDHQLDVESFRKILKMPECGRWLWRMPRYGVKGEKLNSHANTFVLSRGNFIKNFGYDETLCGHYACDDTLFVKYNKYHGSRLGMLMNGVKTQIRSMKIDGYTHSLTRDMSHNKGLVAQKMKDIKRFGRYAGHSREFLNFEWKVTKVSRRSVPQEKKDKLWFYGWWGRWLIGE